MSSNMAASAKAIRVRTSYTQHELKMIKVQIRRHNIKETNNCQLLERDLVKPDSVTSIVHMTGTDYGLLFRHITPNTIHLPDEAYTKKKAAAAQQSEAAPYTQRSASCSSDEQTKHKRRSRSSEKHQPNGGDATRVMTKRRSPSAVDASNTKHKASRSPSQSPPPSKSARRSPAPTSAHRRQHSPSNSPHSPHNRSKSPPPSSTTTSVSKERVRNLSTQKGLFVPDKSGGGSSGTRARDTHSYSKSPSPTRYSSGRNRRRSRDRSRDPGRRRRRSRGDSRDRHRSRSTSSERHRKGSRERDSDSHHSSSQRHSKERHSEDRRNEFVDPEFYQRTPHFNPNMVHPQMLYPAMPPAIPPFYPQAAFPPFFNRPFYAPPDQHAFARQRKRLVYNSRRIPNFTGTTPFAGGKPGEAATSTVTSNGATPVSVAPPTNPGVNGVS